MIKRTALFSLLFSLPALAAQITYLEKPRVALSALYQAISTANKQIDISYYEVQPCHTVTKVLIRAIHERRQARPNLRVRFLFDAHPIEDRAVIALPEHLRRNGIEARVFNNTYKWNPRYNHRTHAKYLVADDKLITGGRNLTDNYYGLRQEEVNWIDADLLIEDASTAAQARKHFQLIWDNNHTYKPESASTDLMNQAQQCLAWGPRERALLDYLKTGHAGYLQSTLTTQCPQAQFVADDMEFSSLAFDWDAQTQIGGGFEKLNRERVDKKPTIRALTRLLAPAQRMTLVNHIYIPFGRTAEIIEQKRNAGVPITLYTNYYRGSGYLYEDIHNYYTKADTRGSQKNYAIGTVARPDLDWEFTPAGTKYSNHPKIYIVNGRDVGVTSLNFDPRSYMHNVESGAFVANCPLLATHIEKSYVSEMTSGLSAQEQAAVKARLKGNYEVPLTKPSDQTMAWLMSQFL